MADDDEVDVLGDFSLDNFLTKNESIYDHSMLTSHNAELLSCDYSLHPQWLLDNPTTNSDCWYTGSSHDFSSVGQSDTNTSLGFDEVICTENKTTDDSGWTEEEKNSLLKGLEIFGKNPVNLSQFVSSKTPTQIKYYLKHYHVKNYLFNNVYNTVDINSAKNLGSCDLPSVFEMSEIIEDAQIPASIEEVIAVVSTAKPTVQNVYKKPSPVRKKNPSYPVKKIKFSQSVLLNVRQKKKGQKRTKPERNVVKCEDVVEVKTEFSPPVVLPVSSCEEVIKIKKENLESESDTEIDIDIGNEEEENSLIIKEEENYAKLVEDNQNVIKEISEIDVEPETPKIENDSEENEILLSKRFSNVDENVLRILTSTDYPLKECVFGQDEISDVEKFLHSEFFEGRPTKTPDRYLKIRNHIIDCWLENKPLYCTKTSVRQGLKNCGDVNCIGRIHHYLEQIGAINFGCEQTCYKRPLLNMMSSTQTKQPKEKVIPVQQQKVEVMRPRMKKKYNNDGEGGYTMMHDENGLIIDTTVINQDKQIKPRNRRQNMKLVFCKSFSDENPAPFTVKLHITALILIDLHAHSAFIEVMGLLGGVFDYATRALIITRYVPCRNIDYSNTHCDMCPISQSKASEILYNEGVDVVGWFHSHPTFYPNPSLQDIDTQLNMQLYLSSDYKPFVGVILSPYRSLANSFVSEYRCLVVNNKENSKDGTNVPYKFQIELTSAGLDVDAFLRHANEVLETKINIPEEYIVDFRKHYCHDTATTYLDKLLSSIKLHLARCSEINKMTCDAIVEGLKEMCILNNNERH